MQSQQSSDFSSVFRKSDPDDYLERFDKKKLFLGLQRHYFLIPCCMLFFTGMTAWISHHFLTNYKAESAVLFQEDEAKNLNINGLSTNRFSLPTILDIIKLPSHFYALKAALGLELSSTQLSLMTDVPVPKNNSNLIRIIAQGSNPNLVIDIANTLAKIAVKSSQEFVKKELQVAMDSIQQELERNKEQLSLQLQAIENFKQTHQYFEMTPESILLLSQVAQTKSKFENAKLQYDSLVVEYENLKKEVSKLPSKVASDNLNPKAIKDSALESRILSLEAALAEARARYSQDNPKLSRLEEELNTLIQRSKEKNDPQNLVDAPILVKNLNKERLETQLLIMQSKLSAAQKNVQDTKKLSAQLEKQIEALPSQQIGFAKLLEGKLLLDEQIKNLTGNLESIKVLLNAPKGSLELYQLAEKATPLKDSLTIKILPILGLLFGTFVGLGVSFFLEMQDNKLRTVKQAELDYTSPCLGIIPDIYSLTPSNSKKNTRFYIRELFDRLESYLQRETNLKIAFTSSLKGEGKTTLSTEFALYLKELNHSVLFVSFDPKDNLSLNEPKPSHCLIDYLKGQVPLESLIQTGKLDWIALLKYDPSMKELLKTPLMDTFWKELSKKYDFIVIDAPSILDTNFGVNILSYTDLSLFIIQSNKTKKHFIHQSLENLEIRGIIPTAILLNRALSVYIDDIKIQKELKKQRKHFFKKFFFWKTLKSRFK